VRRSSGDLSSLLSLFHFSVKGNKAINQLIAIALARRYCQINLEVNPFPMPLFTAIVAILAFWLCLAVVWALLAEILLDLLEIPTASFFALFVVNSME